MKKIVFLLFLIIVSISILSKDNNLLIPDNAIRIRIIANSDNINDQENKIAIKNEVSKFLFNKLDNVKSYNEAQETIIANINNIKSIISGYTEDYEILYGNNHFPSKYYKGTKYKEGDYKSLVIRLGEGKGNNFWCVLFPPLCMIDEEKLDDVSYKLYVSKLLNLIN